MTTASSAVRFLTRLIPHTLRSAFRNIVPARWLPIASPGDSSTDMTVRQASEALRRLVQRDGPLLGLLEAETRYPAMVIGFIQVDAPVA